MAQSHVAVDGDFPPAEVPEDAPEAQPLYPFPYVLVLIKPDGRRPGVWESVRDMFVKSGFILVNTCYHDDGYGESLEAKFAQHYLEHREKPFYVDLVREMSNGPICTHIYRFPDNPKVDEHPITISRNICKVVRAMYQQSVRHNTIHVSDSMEASKHEIEVWMGKDFIRGCLNVPS